MKKILGSAILMAAMAAFCCYVTWRVDEVCTESAALLHQAEQSCENGDFREAEAAVNSAKDVWKQHENLLGLALRHTESEHVDTTYPALLAACQLEDSAEFLLRSRELSATLLQLSHMEKPYLFNIF